MRIKDAKTKVQQQIKEDNRLKEQKQMNNKWN